MLYRFEIHSAFDCLHMALLCFFLAASHLCKAACWQLHLINEPGLQVKAAFFGDRIVINSYCLEIHYSLEVFKALMFMH